MRLKIIDRVPPDRLSSTSRLGAAFLAGDPRALPFYRFGPRDYRSAAAARFAAAGGGRDKLCGALTEVNRSLGAGARTMASIERLRLPKTLAVVTGQQTAPLTGPYYTVLKAATTIALCERLREQEGFDCVPVFWADGDDHDVEEVSRVGLSFGDQGLRYLEAGWSTSGGPIGDLVPSRAWDDVRRDAAELLPPSEYREETLRLAFAQAREGATLGTWFGSLMADLFSPWGLVVAYSRHPSLRKLWEGIVPRILDAGPGILEEVGGAGARIRKAGFKPQLVKKKNDPLFFVVEGGRRLPVRAHSGGYLLGDRKVTAGELARQLYELPGSFSPGVMLRPVVQDGILPTVAYVGGPAEASYFGQLTGVYRRMGVEMPVVQGRFSVTFVEPGRDRVMRKHSLQPSMFVLEPAERIFAQIMRRRGRLGDSRRWRSLEAKSAEPLKRLAGSLAAEYGPLARHLEKVAGQVTHLVREAGDKAAREERAREEQTRKQILDTSLQLCPERTLMERKLSIFYFLAKYGRGFLDEVCRSVPEDLDSHYFMSVGEGA